ncbi:MAG: hypothetical protein HY299_08960 [Verrucomicrobia bacterium]|nr:hypothetical protein [Verrucomicrobiota bacterium]
MKTAITTFAGAWLFLCSLALASAQSTAFTYNGRLNNGGAPVNGSYEMQFTVYDSEAGGIVVAGPRVMSPVNVANGLFTLRLDFGAGVFTGPARWLDIAVRPVGGGGFAGLAPRQEVTASPYAIQAQTAGSVANSSVAVSQLNTGGLAPKPGQILSYNGGNLFWTDPGVAAGGIWSLQNNNAYYGAGNVGVGGVASGSSKLQITGADALTMAGPGPYLTWHDTLSGRSAVISSASGTLYYRVPNAAGTVITAGYVDSNGSVIKGRLSLEGAGPYITWNDSTSGRSATISSTLGTLYYRVPDAAGTVVTAGYVDSNGSVIRGRLSLEGTGAYSGINLLTADPTGLKFGSRLGQQLWLWSDPASTRYFGLGMQASTLYSRCGGGGADGFAWYKGGAHDDHYHNAGGGKLLMSLDSSGLSVTTLTILGGADLAEPFELSDASIARGSVVIIDSENAGKLKLSNGAYDQRVAGVVSGANGVNPGISLRQEGVLGGGQNVALSGRVYVLADANVAPIQPGDLLTTSDTPGHAMKVADHGKAQGAILGKAMSGLKEGRGLVLVLVTLQ